MLEKICIRRKKNRRTKFVGKGEKKETSVVRVSNQLYIQNKNIHGDSGNFFFSWPQCGSLWLFQVRGTLVTDF